MVYVIDGLIEAIDYNNFRLQTSNIYGVGFGDSGYGQQAAPNPSPIALADVAVDDVVQAQEWINLVDAVEICRSHQGSTTFPTPFSDLLAEVQVGEVVEAHEGSPPTLDPADVNGSLVEILGNRLVADAGSVAIMANELNASRASSWTTLLTHTFQVTHPTADEARYFYNSGGQIRIRGSRSGGAVTPQNTAWTTMLSSMGTVILDAHSTITTGSPPTFIASGIGYYELGTTFQTIYSLNGTAGYAYSSYSGNLITIEARTISGLSGSNADNGRDIEFRVQYQDIHANPFSDVVTGTITSDVDMRIATSPLFINDPVFTGGTLSGS